MAAAMPAKYSARVFLRPMRSAKYGARRHPIMVPTDKIAVPRDASLVASAAE